MQALKRLAFPLTLVFLGAGVTPAAKADGTIEKQYAIKLLRGNTVLAASDPNSDVYVSDFSMEACLGLKARQGQEEMATRTSGKATYKCQLEDRDVITFTPPQAPPSCGDRPGQDLQEQRQCPAGTVGTWIQDRIWTLNPYPACWVQGDWTPAEPPVGMCPPAEIPQTLPAPANIEARGTSPSTILVTWSTVLDAAAYSFERCIGATCTSFSQLTCVREPTETHSHLPANLTARYRVRASKTANCQPIAGCAAPADCTYFGAYSAIVSGTTLSATPLPVDCAVSPWSAYTAGAWSACSNGQQSRTETRTRTVTTQPSNGGAACPVLSETRTVTQPCTTGPSGGDTLTWGPVTQNTDGTPLPNLAGYRLHYGRNGGTPYTRQVGPDVTSFRWDELPNISPGDWHVCAKAFTTDGKESACSNVLYRTVR